MVSAGIGLYLGSFIPNVPPLDTVLIASETGRVTIANLIQALTACVMILTTYPLIKWLNGKGIY